MTYITKLSSWKVVINVVVSVHSNYVEKLKTINFKNWKEILKIHDGCFMFAFSFNRRIEYFSQVYLCKKHFGQSCPEFNIL